MGNDPFEFVAPMDKGPIICHHKKGPLVMITYTVFLCDKGLRGKYVGVHTRSRYYGSCFSRVIVNIYHLYLLIPWTEVPPLNA